MIEKNYQAHHTDETISEHKFNSAEITQNEREWIITRKRLWDHVRLSGIYKIENPKKKKKGID